MVTNESNGECEVGNSNNINRRRCMDYNAGT